MATWYYDENGNKVKRSSIGVIHFENERQRFIFEREILGQLSDGLFENDCFDWNFWHSLDTVADGTLGWTADYVPDRMAFDFYGLDDLLDRIKIKAICGEIGVPLEYSKAVEDYLLFPDSSLKNEYQRRLEETGLNPIDIAAKVKDRLITYTDKECWNDIEAIAKSMATSMKKIGFVGGGNEWNAN